MIERKFVEEKLREFQVQEYIGESLRGVGQSHTTIQRTPLGEKVIIHASKPGLVVGRGGENIRKLTRDLKKKFGLENPQIEINEVKDVNLDANIIAERIAVSLERFGSSKFKAIGHKTMDVVMKSGALGVEILISGKIPGSRAKRWRFYKGYLKKCGDIALTGILKSYKNANLKTGVIGIQVRIMPPDIELPDKITYKDLKEEVAEKGGVEEQPVESDDKNVTEKSEKSDKPAEEEKKDEEVKAEKSEKSDKPAKEDKKDEEIKAEKSDTEEVPVKDNDEDIKENAEISDEPAAEEKKEGVEAEKKIEELPATVEDMEKSDDSKDAQELETKEDLEKSSEEKKDSTESNDENKVKEE